MSEPLSGSGTAAALGGATVFAGMKLPEGAVVTE
ncbi:Uncharacterised protein [Escherichia coli]|nr:Uncharacterised protein [Escherichia coli]